MPVITFDNKEYYARDGELLLDCLVRHGVVLDVDGRCEDGSCQRCKLWDISPVSAAKAGSSPSGDSQRKGSVLPCMTMVWHSMAVVDSEPVGSAEPTTALSL